MSVTRSNRNSQSSRRLEWSGSTYMLLTQSWTTSLLAGLYVPPLRRSMAVCVPYAIFAALPLLSGFLSAQLSTISSTLSVTLWQACSIEGNGFS